MTTKQERMHDRIRKHGEQLLAIFPGATERDPVQLCKKLRRWEAAGNAFALRLCNGPPYSTEDAENDEAARIMAGVGRLLQFQAAGVPVLLNRDPRGYALKVDDDWQREQKQAGKPYIGHEDWGGYGLIAPDLTND